jgi:hypothetical protein
MLPLLSGSLFENLFFLTKLMIQSPTDNLNRNLTGKFFAESMKTVSRAVLMSVTRSICVSAKAAFKSFLSLLSCIHVNLK